MTEDETKRMSASLSFEEKVLRHLEEVSSGIEEVRSRVVALERREAERDMDTKPGFDHILAEVRNINANIETYLKNFDRKLDVVNSELLQVKADQRALEVRVRKVEIDSRPQVIPQDRQF